jgi:hypothetical protein
MKLFELKKISWYDVLIVLLSSTFLIYFYGPILIAPNEFLFAKYGDGFSQYFNFVTYVKYSQSYFEHTVANYPYGEQIVYFDGQPFFAALTKLLANVFPFLGDYVVGIMNGLALFAIWWTPLLLYGILSRIDVKPIFAVWGAMGIVFLEPQIFRLTGHFSLSYCCAIPLTIYLLLRIYEQKKVHLWAGFLLFSNLMWLYTHPYLGLMCCLLTGVVFFFYWCWNFRAVAAKINYYILGFVSGVLPVVIFQIVTKLTDNHTSKTEDVYGLFEYCGAPEDVFLPNHPPFKKAASEFVGWNLDQTWEGWSYVGVVTIVTLLLVLIIGILKKIRNLRTSIESTTHPAVKILFLASIPVLLLSWAYPFIQYPALLDYVKVITQFRSLGRFSWVFYYVSTLVSIYYIHRGALFLKEKKQGFLAALLLFSCPLLYMVEGYSAHAEVAENLDLYPNYFLEKNCPEVLKDGLEQINVADYQAILPLPYYYLGSGNFYRTVLGGTTHFSMLTSIYTGIPLATAFIARGDVWESRNLVQLFTAPYYDKKIKTDFPSQKPFLITRSNYIEPLSVHEQEVFDRARLISIDKHGYALYALDFKDLFILENNQVLDKFKKTSSTLYPKDDWLLEDSTADLFYENFEDLPSKHAFRGKGAFSAPKKGSGTFVKMPLEAKDKPATYKIKAWVFNGEIDAMNHLYIIAFGANDGGVWDRLGQVRPDRAPIIKGDWSLVEFSVNIPPNKFKNLHLDYYCGIASKRTVYIDEVLIYSGKGAVYKPIRQENDRVEELIYNGHHVLRKEASIAR